MRKSPAAMVGGFGKSALPSGLRMTSPVFASCAARRGRTKNVDIAAGLQQPAAEIAADRAGANHKDTHRFIRSAPTAGRFGTSKLPVNIITVSSF